MTTTRTTVKQLKNAGAPAEIVNKVSELAGRKQIRVNMVPAGTKVYLQEDYRYSFFSADGQTANISMGGEWGGYKTGIESAIGAGIQMPFGSWIIEHGFFLGHLMIYVHHAGSLALA